MAIRYSDEILKLAVKAAGNGADDDEVIALLGCARSTYYVWQRDKPEFKRAIADARKPSNIAEELDRYALRKQQVEEWLDDYVKNRGEVVEETISTIRGDGAEITTKRTTGKMPDLRLIDRILGVNTAPEEFTLKIEIAEPEADLDDFDEDE
jgi:hypothetical protein